MSGSCQGYASIDLLGLLGMLSVVRWSLCNMVYELVLVPRARN